MIRTLINNWWAIALRGLFAVIFGILAFVWPQLTVLALVILFGVYVIWDGILAIVSAVRQRGESENWWVFLLEGIIGIAAGIIAFIWPEITAIALVFLIAAWALLTGIFEIVAAIRLRKSIENEWWLLLSGLLSIVLAVLLVIWPGSGSLAIVWIIAAYAILFGILLILLGFRLRTLKQEIESGSQTA